ncbi:recombinase RecA [Candidatus Nomurabacteria bacterium]|nr:recombinase RecA [Candidatus Nomurabacteria bacterium]
MSAELDKMVAAINTKFGKGSVLLLSEKPEVDIDVIPSGSLGIDIATGIGGYPRGRIVEIYGQESSGKTTLAIHAIAEAQKKGGICAMIDAEHSFDLQYAKKLGVDPSRLYVSQPSSGEQALEIASSMIKSCQIAICVVDSVAALVPEAEINGEMGDSNVGVHARLMSQAMRKLTGDVSRSNTCMIFINQMREKIGVMFGNPETTTGGNALKFYASMRLHVTRQAAPSKDKDSVAVASKTKVRISKNKLAPPFTEASFDIVFGRGISMAGEVIDAATDLEIVKKSGSWYSYDDTKLGQGRDATIALLLENPELLDELREQIMLTTKENK